MRAKNGISLSTRLVANQWMLLGLGVLILCTIVGLVIGFVVTGIQISGKIGSIDGISVPAYEITAVDPNKIIIVTNPTGFTIDTYLTPADITCNGTFGDSCLPPRIKTINSMPPNGALDFIVEAGSNILISPLLNGLDVATTEAVSFTMLAVSQTTMLGSNTSCVRPLLPSCYDISGQTCTTPLYQSCLPLDASFNNLVVGNLTLLSNGTNNIHIGNQTSFYVDMLYVNDQFLNGSLTCTQGGSISSGCLNLGGYSCPLGVPLADSCIPASLPFYNLDVTNLLQINQIQCLGQPINGSCINIDNESCLTPVQDSCVPTRVRTINGVLPDGALNYEIYGGNGVTVGTTANGTTISTVIIGTTNQVNVVNTIGSTTLSLPQDIATTSTPEFAAVVLNSSTFVSTSGTPRTYTVADPGGDANLVTDVGGPLTITNTPSAGYLLVASAATTAAWMSAANSGIKVTVVTLAMSPYSFTFQPTTVWVKLFIIGGGGGGGSGEFCGANQICAGGSSGGISSLIYEGLSSSFPPTVTVQVGYGGPGGAAQTVGNLGNSGYNGGASSFGSLSCAGGPGGFGGQGSISGATVSYTGSMTQQTAIVPTNYGGTGALTSFIAATAGSNVLSTVFRPATGGGGGGYNAGNTPVSGAVGGFFIDYVGTVIVAGGSAGIVSVSPGSNGASSVGTYACCGAGGGGGTPGSSISVDGGNGGFPGGSGGGGSASQTAPSSGAGGAGADGQITIIEMY